MKCNEIYPRTKKYYFFNSQNNPIYCYSCKEKNSNKKNKKNNLIEKEE